MNEYERLFNIKKEIEQKISEQKLFLLSREDAIITVCDKFGIFYRCTLSATKNDAISYIKEKAKSNSEFINIIEFMQESIKWIFRWIFEYCKEESKWNEKITAEEIYDLMGMAYSYDRFYRMWKLHSKHKVDYKIFGNKLEFSCHNEKAYIVHKYYSERVKIDSENKIMKNVLRSNKAKNDIELINQIHESDFDLGLNFQFSGFDLNDYRIFSTALNTHIANKLFNNQFLFSGKEEIIILKREEWIDFMSKSCELKKEKIVSIIDFFTYNCDDSKSDLSLSYFLPYSNGYLLLLKGIFFMQRPEKNALRILSRVSNSTYSSEQNRFEETQRSAIINKINNKYLVTQIYTRKQKIRSGMDVLVYDKENNHLQVIELKYKIPVESVEDDINLDEMLKNAYEQLGKAKQIVNEKRSSILEEYFGEEFKGISPNIVDYFVITNYSIGTGANCELPSKILLESHYCYMMKSKNGMQKVHEVLNDPNKGCKIFIKKRYARYSLNGYKIMIPEYRVNNN